MLALPDRGRTYTRPPILCAANSASTSEQGQSRSALTLLRKTLHWNQDLNVASMLKVIAELVCCSDDSRDFLFDAQQQMGLHYLALHPRTPCTAHTPLLIIIVHPCSVSP